MGISDDCDDGDGGAKTNLPLVRLRRSRKEDKAAPAAQVQAKGPTRRLISVIMSFQPGKSSKAEWIEIV